MSETETEPTAFEEVLAEQSDTLLSESKPPPRIAKMRELAELAAAAEPDDLSWLPENYRRDTFHETALVLLESQKEAQAQMVAARTERNELERRNLELEQALQALYEPQAYEQPVYDQFEYEQPAYAPAPQFDRQQIAAMANQVVQEKLLTPQAAAIADQAEQLVASQIPEYAANRDRVYEAVQNNPSLIAAAAATGDVREIAGALASVHQSLAGPPNADLMRTMKIQAQSAVGAGGRMLGVSDGEQRWQEIATADTGKLGL